MIRSYPSSLSRPLAPTPRTESAPAQAPAGAGPSRASASAESAPDLSPDERAMIERSFPDTERMTLRLYGPHRPAELNPGGLGGRLDLKG